MRKAYTLLVFFFGSLLCYGQAASDTIFYNLDSIAYTQHLEEVQVVQSSSKQFVQAKQGQLIVNMEDINSMPKVLGTSDPIRYLQTLAGIQTNSESRTGLHIQGCDDYQTLISINNAPVFYPNHLLGLFSTFITSHFDKMVVEQAEHNGLMTNRIGGWVDLRTHHLQPTRFSIEGNIGLINSDVSLAIPCGNKSALWISARTSYVDVLYKKWLTMEDLNVGYHFMDFNLTYALHPTEKDEIVLTAFYSRDKGRVKEQSCDISLTWQNLATSLYWQRNWTGGHWRTTGSFSAFRNNVVVGTSLVNVNTDATFANAELYNQLYQELTDHIRLEASLDYVHCMTNAVDIHQTGLNMHLKKQPYIHTDEVSAGIDMRHSVKPWMDYRIGLHVSGYHSNRWFGGIDPRLSVHFYPAKGHEIALHIGTYSQYFHKAALLNGGLPTDFFLTANSDFKPERAHAINLRYSASLLNGKLVLQAEGFFKQIFDVVESTGNIFQLINKDLDYTQFLMTGKGRNFGCNVMLQKPRGIITGYISYSLGWALRQLPDLDGSKRYIYSASHERRHDLNIVMNARFAKRWEISAQFVLASGLPYTRAKQAYMLNNKMICEYDTYNGAHIPVYHRLDLSVSCDIINKNGHNLGINLSLYNVYCAKNAQFIIYRENLQEVKGTSLSMILPSISIYGKF